MLANKTDTHLLRAKPNLLDSTGQVCSTFCERSAPVAARRRWRTRPASVCYSHPLPIKWQSHGRMVALVITDEQSAHSGAGMT
jgi:hypothetical protein